MAIRWTPMRIAYRYLQRRGFASDLIWQRFREALASGEMRSRAVRLCSQRTLKSFDAPDMVETEEGRDITIPVKFWKGAIVSFRRGDQAISPVSFNDVGLQA